jgi:DNA-binding protein HU-beta
MEPSLTEAAGKPPWFGRGQPDRFFAESFATGFGARRDGRRKIFGKNLNTGHRAIAIGHLIHNNLCRAFPISPRELVDMNRKELVDALAAKTDSTKADAERAVGALIDIISGTLKKGDSLTLVGFGTFEVRKRAARTGRNPKTGEELKIKAAKVPAFKAGATLKALVNGAKK